LLLSLAVILGIGVARWLGHERGLDRKKLVDTLIWGVVGAVLGGRLLGSLVESLREGRLVVLEFRETGAVHGAVLCGVVAFGIALKGSKLDVRDAFDAVAPAGSVALAVGRVGCFLAGCCYGGPTNVAWGVPAPEELGAHSIHPVQLYEAFGHVVMAALLIVAFRRRKLRGELAMVFFVLEGFLRVFVEAYRGDAARGVWSLGLTTGQLTGLLFVALGGTGSLIVRLRLNTRAARKFNQTSSQSE
jgi:phosphatidylglycerol:prolipoprotein diacylglycerol transferase